VLVHYSIPKSVLHLLTGSLGGALGVSHQIGGALGAGLAAVARRSFVSGLDLAVSVGAIVVGTAALVVLLLLPNRAAKHHGNDAHQVVAAGNAGPVPS
jgi:multisubunit Na+/H+ antiporter MnhC subunit